MRALTSHQCGPGSILRLGVICGLSLLVLYSAPRGFLWVLLSFSNSSATRTNQSKSCNFIAMINYLGWLHYQEPRVGLARLRGFTQVVHVIIASTHTCMPIKPGHIGHRQNNALTTVLYWLEPVYYSHSHSMISTKSTVCTHSIAS